MTRRSIFALPVSALAADTTAELHRAIRGFIEDISVRQNVARAMRWADPEREQHPLMKQARPCLSGPPGLRDQSVITLRLIAEKRFASWAAACNPAELEKLHEGVVQAGIPLESQWPRDGYIAVRLTPEVIDRIRSTAEPDATGLALLTQASTENQAVVIIAHRVFTLIMLWRRTRQGWRFLVLIPGECD